MCDQSRELNELYGGLLKMNSTPPPKKQAMHQTENKGRVQNTDPQSMDYPYQGSNKPPSGRPGQVDFPLGQVTFSPHMPHGQEPRQAVRRLNL